MSCQRAFRHYPKGGRTPRPEPRLRALAALFWALGLSEVYQPVACCYRFTSCQDDLLERGPEDGESLEKRDKKELIEVGKAEQLTCPKCGDTLEPGAAKLAKLNDDFHDVFSYPGCKHIFSPNHLKCLS